MGSEILTKRRAIAGGALIGKEHVPQFADVILTNAQVLALRATPIALVAAPGLTNVLRMFSHAVLVATTTAGAYTETDDNLVIRQTNGTGVVMSDDIETTGWLDGTAIKMSSAHLKINVIGGLLNKALVLHNSGDGEFGGGNAANSLRVRCYYTDLVLTGWGTLA
jgi:hypothetical protein